MVLPKIDLEQAKTYVEAITRMGDIMALCSFLPVLFECRFGKRLERLSNASQQRKEERQKAAQPKAKQKQKGNQKEEPKEQKEQPEPNDEPENQWPCLPLGPLSLFLFALAEVVSCWTMWVPPPAKAAAKGKGPAVEGPLGVFIEAAKKAIAAVEAMLKKKKKSEAPLSGTGDFGKSVEKSALIVMETLTGKEAFDACHSFVILVALMAVAVSMLGHYVKPVTKSFFFEARSPVRCGLFCLVPLALFGALQLPTLAKVWKGMQELVPSLPRPLRVAAIILANVPGPGKAPELPAFAVMQAGSLMAAVSAEIANGRLGAYLAMFFKGGDLSTTMVDSRVMTFLVPTLLAVTWLCIVHLRTKVGFLFLALLVSAVSSPVLLINGWKEVAPLLGVDRELATALTQVLSVIYVTFTFSLLMAGGTLTLMSTAVLGNLLIRIHGHDAFNGLLW